MSVVNKECECCTTQDLLGEKKITGKIWMICPKICDDGRRRAFIITLSTST